MITIPYIATVADLQRKYKYLTTRIRKTGQPLLVVNRGKADVVVMDADYYDEKITKLRKLEEEYLLRVMEEGLEEYKKGKTKKLDKDKTLLDIL